MLLLGGCAAGRQAALAPAGQWKEASIAVLPIENLSASPAPIRDIENSLRASLSSRGVKLLSEAALEDFMARHRMRYTGGIDGPLSAAIMKETGVRAVLITALELYSPYGSPKVALISRLVQTGEDPKILWTDSVGMAGDEHPGFLETGLIMDPKALTDKAIGRLTGSLTGFMAGEVVKKVPDGKRRFRPKFFYKAEELTPGRKYKVAVAPFFNKSEHKYAGEIVMLHFIEQMFGTDGIEIIEPGVLRDDLLSLRVVMEEGLTLDTANIVLDTTRADLLLMGSVLDYQDYQGVFGTPRVDFTVQLVEKKSLQLVWSSKSYGHGDDGVFFFNLGRINTASKTASQMVDNVVKMMEAP